MKSVLVTWERTYSLSPDRVQWIGPDDGPVRAAGNPIESASAPSPWARASGNMTVRIDHDRASRLRSRRPHHPENDEVDHHERDSGHWFEVRRRPNGAPPSTAAGF